MTSFRPARHWLPLLLFYIAIDLMDPSIPGVFFFDTEFFFVDGVVRAKSDVSSNLVAVQPLRISATVDYDAVRSTVNAQASPRPLPAHMRWKKLKHDDSASCSSASPEDSTSTPPLS
jgi:hypothetical protein